MVVLYLGLVLGSIQIFQAQRSVPTEHKRISGDSQFDSLVNDYVMKFYKRAGEEYLWYNFNNPEIRTTIPNSVMHVARTLALELGPTLPKINLRQRYMVHRLLGVIAYWNYRNGMVEAKIIEKLLKPILELSDEFCAPHEGEIRELLDSVHDQYNLEFIGLIGLSKKLIAPFFEQISILVNSRSINRQLLDSLFSISAKSTKILEQEISLRLNNALKFCIPQIFGHLLPGFDCYVEKYFSENFGHPGLLYLDDSFGIARGLWLDKVKTEDPQLFKKLNSEAQNILRSRILISPTARRYRIHRFLGIMEFVKLRKFLPTDSFIVDYHTAWNDPETRRDMNSRLDVMRSMCTSLLQQQVTDPSVRIFNNVIKNALAIVGLVSWSPSDQQSLARDTFSFIETILKSLRVSSHQPGDELPVIDSIVLQLNNTLRDRISRFHKELADAQRRVGAVVNAFANPHSRFTNV